MAKTRKRSKLTIAGDEAAAVAKRKLLLKTLRAHGFSLVETATALDMAASSSVLAAIAELDLTAEYEKARAAGKVRVGRPKTKA